MGQGYVERALGAWMASWLRSCGRYACPVIPVSAESGSRRREPHPYLGGELVVVIDCSDLERSAEFWTGVLGYARDGVASGRYQTLLPADGQGAEILLQQVPEDKHGKNRVHLDLRTRDLDPELHRVVSLGARVLTQEPVREAGWQWHILADPDGNEFCVLQPPASHWTG
jgi:predicted enzyme related to lactoylglutathione lyase